MNRHWIAAVGVLMGCGPAGEPVDRAFADVEDAVPLLKTATVDCDIEAGRWTVKLVTEGWTGGVNSAWSVDGAYVELHDVPRVAWAEDGTREELTLNLGIVEDFREAGAGSTAFTCAADPSGVLEVRNTRFEVVDCRAWGPDPALFDDLEDVPTCDVLLERTR